MPPSRGLRSPISTLGARALVAAVAFCAAVAGWLPGAQGRSSSPIVAMHPFVPAGQMDDTAGIATEESSSTPAPASIGPRADTHWMAVAVLPTDPAVTAGAWRWEVPPTGEQPRADDGQAAACRDPPEPIVPALSV